MSDAEYTAGALFEEGDIPGPDHSEENIVLDMRQRFDALDNDGKIKVAEMLLILDAKKLSMQNATYTPELISARIRMFLNAGLGALEQIVAGRVGKCMYCKESVEETPHYDRQIVWVIPGTNQVVDRTESGERAHEACVKRLKEGGSDEEPMF